MTVAKEASLTFAENCDETGHGESCEWIVSMPRVVLGTLTVLAVDRDRFIQHLRKCEIDIVEE